jgi:hypothetical protein
MFFVFRPRLKSEKCNGHFTGRPTNISIYISIVNRYISLSAKTAENSFHLLVDSIHFILASVAILDIIGNPERTSENCLMRDAI